MLIFFEEIIMQVFLWLLKIIDAVTGFFGSLTGISELNYMGNPINVPEFFVNNSTVSMVLWCVIILAVGVSCIFAIVAVIKNIISSNRNVSVIVGKFFLAILGTLAILIVVILGILISGAVLQLVARIFEADMSIKLSDTLFNLCVGEWLDGYSVAEIDFSTVTVREIMGEYDAATVFGIFPTAWKMNGMINPDKFMFAPAFIFSGLICAALLISVIRLAKRIYEIVFMYITMPLFLSTITLDDGARFTTWREAFVSKILTAFGTVFAVSIYLIISPFISRIGSDAFGGNGSAIFKMVLITGGILSIPAGQTLFAKIFRGSGGQFVRDNGTISYKDVKNILHRNYNVMQKDYLSYNPTGSDKYNGDYVPDADEIKGEGQ